MAVLGGALAVLGVEHGQARLIRSVPLPSDANGTGAAVTPDGRLLLIASNAGISVYDEAGLERGGTGFLGELQTPDDLACGDAVEVSTSRDGRLAFVSLEPSGALAVFNLTTAASSGWRRSGFVGRVRFGGDVVGSAISPDGETLYVTSQEAREPDATGQGSLPTLAVSDLARHPDQARIHDVFAGCAPVRVAVSPDGQRVAVSARGSNDVELFDAKRLIGDPAQARLSVTTVGAAPVGLAYVDQTHIVVANSDRFSTTGTEPNITVLTTSRSGDTAQLSHQYQAGAFPREVLVDPTAGVVIISDYTAEQIQIIPLKDVS